MEKRIEPHMIGAFLQEEHQYYNELPQGNDITTFINKRLPSMSIPNNKNISEEEAILILGPTMFKQLKKFI